MKQQRHVNGEKILDYKIFANRLPIPPPPYSTDISILIQKRGTNLGMVRVGNQSCCLMRKSNLLEKYWLGKIVDMMVIP
jgi:hypothetical protein